MRWSHLLTAVLVIPVGLSTACQRPDPRTDSDSDGLPDVVETELGTDPNAADSDGDGYSDFDENQAGTDPLDENSRIYHGGWPFNPDKDSLGDPSWDSTAEVGAQIPHYQAKDQYDELVDLYDFGGHDLPIVLDMGTIWCGPCKGMAAYLSDGDTAHVEEYAWWRAEYEGLHEAVSEGRILWVTVLFSPNENSPADLSHTQGWHEDYPNERIPVLADTDDQLYSWIGVTSYPVLNLLDSDLTLSIYDDGGPYSVLTELPPLID